MLSTNRGRETSTSGRRSLRRPALACESLEGRALTSTLRQDVSTLVHDLYTIHQGSSVTPAEVKAVASDLAAIAKVAAKPDPETVATLKTDVQDAAADGTFTPAEIVRIQKDATAVLTSANIPTSMVQKTVNDFKVVLTSSGLTKAEVTTIANDVRAILTDLQQLKK